jgi:hypothetical protein
MLKSIILLVLFVSIAVASAAQIHTQIVGDSVRIKTKDTQRLSVWHNGVVNIARTDTTSRPVFRFYPNGDFSSGTNNDYTPNQSNKRNGIRFNKKLGIFEIGISNNLDTSLNIAIGDQGSYETSGLIVNSDNANTINSPMISSIISGDNILLDSNGALNWSIITGESHSIYGSMNKSFLNGHGEYVGGTVTGSLMTGISNRFDSTTFTTLVNGYVNRDLDSTASSLVSGSFNRFSGAYQFLSGLNLISQNWASTTLGSANVSFSSLTPVKYTQPDSLMKYPLLSIGNSSSYNTLRSNALTMMYSGRTQINTTGYSTALSQADVTPKAALEVVSTNSGILIPRLSTTQRNAIVAGDLHNGLMIYNSTDSKFQYYDGSAWKTLGTETSTSTPAGVYIHSYDAQEGVNATTHMLRNVPAGALLVLTTSAGTAVTDLYDMYSSPSLTWTKRADASASSSGDAEIYTAVFTAGGDIQVTSSWRSQPQASVCYVIMNQETTLGGATATGTAQSAPSVNITTTRANSLIIAVTSDWNALHASATYRNTATVAQYNHSFSNGTFYHYFKQATTATSYTMGLSAPTGQSGGTALIEIRGN